MRLEGPFCTVIIPRYNNEQPDLAKFSWVVDLLFLFSFIFLLGEGHISCCSLQYTCRSDIILFFLSLDLCRPCHDQRSTCRLLKFTIHGKPLTSAAVHLDVKKTVLQKLNNYANVIKRVATMLLFHSGN